MKTGENVKLDRGMVNDYSIVVQEYFKNVSASGLKQLAIEYLESNITGADTNLLQEEDRSTPICL